MRYIRYAILALIAIVLVSMSLANRGPLTLALMPDAVADFVGWNLSITLPIFVVILCAVGAGVLLGYILEWLREHRHRRNANVKAREVRKLEREVSKLKTEKNKGKDEVLAILEDAV